MTKAPTNQQPGERLSVGCGRRPAEAGWTRLDKSPAVKPDVIWDLDRTPYPFEDSTFVELECLDVIEHLTDITKAMEEFHRILKPDGLLRLTTPHFSCANSFIDPTHKWHLSVQSFDYFWDHELDYYSVARFKLRKRHIQFSGGRVSRSIVSRLANKYAKTYEQRFAWMWPAWFIYFELEAAKPL